MPNVNGHGPKRAALYRRVSGEEQKTRGYSLPDQRVEQLEYCARENLEIVKEFEDAGYSGKFLERPELDELRDLVAAGGVNVVVVSKETAWLAACMQATSKTSSSAVGWGWRP
jgi:site-specific DNA recombinase